MKDVKHVNKVELRLHINVKFVKLIIHIIITMEIVIHLENVLKAQLMMFLLKHVNVWNKLNVKNVIQQVLQKLEVYV